MAAPVVSCARRKCGLSEITAGFVLQLEELVSPSLPRGASSMVARASLGEWMRWVVLGQGKKWLKMAWNGRGKVFQRTRVNGPSRARVFSERRESVPDCTGICRFCERKLHMAVLG